MTRLGYYTTKDVIEILKISRTTFFNWERAGKLPKARRHPMNNFRVYKKEDIDNMKKIVEKGLK